jgi:hypothetical protein
MGAVDGSSGAIVYDESAILLESLSIRFEKDSGGIQELPLEFVYAKDQGEWYIFENDDRLHANLSLAGIIKLMPGGGISINRLQPPECINKLKIGNDERVPPSKASQPTGAEAPPRRTEWDSSDQDK